MIPIIYVIKNKLTPKLVAIFPFFKIVDIAIPIAINIYPKKAIPINTLFIFIIRSIVFNSFGLTAIDIPIVEAPITIMNIQKYTTLDDILLQRILLLDTGLEYKNSIVPSLSSSIIELTPSIAP